MENQQLVIVITDLQVPIESVLEPEKCAPTMFTPPAPSYTEMSEMNRDWDCLDWS